MGLNASSMFPEGIIKMTNGGVDFDTHTLRAVLVKASFANTTLTDTNRDAFDFLNDIPSADRSKAANFVVINTADIVKDAANNNVNYAGGTVSLAFTVVTSGTSCRGIVVFKSSSGTESACPVLCYNHLAANVTADGGTVTVTLHADGLFRASYAA